jgi:hypothetical protein
MTGERIAAITRAIDARDRRDDRGFRRQVTQTRPGAASMALHPMLAVGLEGARAVPTTSNGSYLSCTGPARCNAAIRSIARLRSGA